MIDAYADRWGSPVAARIAPAVHLLDDAVEQVVRLSGDPASSAAHAVATDGDMVLGRVLQAYLALSSTGAAGIDAARTIAAGLDAQEIGGERELLHVRAVRSWIGGDLEQALANLARALLHDPRDLLALKIAQGLSLVLGDTSGLYDLVHGVLPAWPAGQPGWGYVQGMAAFGLAENGSHAEAAQRARAALRADPGDVWAGHALAHVYEMTGHQQAGIAFLTGSKEHWVASSFAIHNWWHLALFSLELGDADSALDLYDGPIRTSGSQEWADLVDAASLLWRLRLFGVDVGDRATRLTAEVEGLLEHRVSVFNDWHAVMAAGLAGRAELCEQLISANLREVGGTNGRSVDAAGLDLLAGFAAFAQEDWAVAVSRLRDLGARAHVVGGSHAQRAVIDLTLFAAAAREGRAAAAAVRRLSAVGSI